MSKREITRINLLRREARRLKKRKARIGFFEKEFPFALGRGAIVIAVIIAVFVLCFVGYSWHLSSVIKSKERVLAKKRAELKRLKDVYMRISRLENKRKELDSMVNVVEKLSAGRDCMIQFFEGLESTIPPISWLSSLEFNRGAVRLEGYALEDKGVADFMDNLARFPWVSRCKLGYIKEVKFAHMMVKEFSFTVSLR